MEWLAILRRFDLINLIALALVWWSLNTKFDRRFSELDQRITGVETRLTVIETVMLCNKMMPSHVAANQEQ